MRQINGVVTSTLALKSGLTQLDHDVRVLCPSYSSRFKYENRIFGVPSIKTKFIHDDVRIPIPGIAKNIINRFHEWKPDVVHSQTEFFMMQIAFRICQRHNISLVHTYHTMWTDPQYLNTYTKGLLAEKLIIKHLKGRLERANRLIVPTDKTKDLLLGYNVKIPIHVIPSGIEFKEYSDFEKLQIRKSLRRKFRICDSSKVLIYIGRVSSEKNIEEIIDFAIRVNREDSNIQLVIVGGGKNIDKFRQLALELSKDSMSPVKFLGPVPTEEVSKYYLLGDIFVTASTSETQGITYFEAMAAGIPVLCRKDSSLNEIIANQRSCYMYNDYLEFSRYCHNLLHSSDLKRQTADLAIKISKKYSVRRFAESALKVYTNS